MTNQLAAPFPYEEIQWRPGATSGNRALALAYIDAPTVMDRLDAVVGLGNWQDDYELLPDHCVVCKLRVKIDGEWIAKADVGAPSEQPDQGDRLKAAYSDALKRAAVKWGIGRYLRQLPHQWVDYDPTKKRFTSTPCLPTWALPQANGKPVHAPLPMPTDGPEMVEWLMQASYKLKTDARLKGKDTPSLYETVHSHFLNAGWDTEVANWTKDKVPQAVQFAREEARKILASIRKEFPE